MSSEAMSSEEIATQTLAVLLEIAPEVDPAELNPDRNFRDQYEIDSVDFLNFVLALEKKMGVKIAEIDYPKLSSLNGCSHYLAGKITSSSTP